MKALAEFLKEILDAEEREMPCDMHHDRASRVVTVGSCKIPIPPGVGFSLQKNGNSEMMVIGLEEGASNDRS